MAEWKWYKVLGKQEAASRIPVGKLQLVKLGKRRICIAHTEMGYSAVSDACTHLGESLCKGSTNFLNEIICPWHGYRFNLENGRESNQRAPDLEVYKIELREDGLYLGVLRKGSPTNEN